MTRESSGSHREREAKPRTVPKSAFGQKKKEARNADKAEGGEKDAKCCVRRAP